MSHEVHKVRVRAALKPNRSPYWGPNIAADLCIGFRKIDEDRGTWIARLRNEKGAVPRYFFESLGLATTEHDYEAARAAALKWRAERDAGITDDVRTKTVADACRAYVEDRRKEKGEACAHDAEKRFERTVYDTPFGATRLSKLRTQSIKAWRDGMGLKKGSADRTRASVVAALNLAVENGWVSPAAAHEWEGVKPHGSKATKRRDVFLDLSQRRALLDRLGGALRDLVEAAALTGARAGELTSAKRGQFDSRTETMTFIGKTGRRDVPLSPAAVTLFERLSRSKLPAAHLLVRDDGRPWAHSDWDELIAEAAQLARLPRGVCLYTLRHSFITAQLLGGTPTLEVARIVGTSVSMIEKHYGHLVATVARERLAKVQML